MAMWQEYPIRQVDRQRAETLLDLLDSAPYRAHAEAEGWLPQLSPVDQRGLVLALLDVVAFRAALAQADQRALCPQGQPQTRVVEVVDLLDRLYGPDLLIGQPSPHGPSMQAALKAVRCAGVRADDAVLRRAMNLRNERILRGTDPPRTHQSTWDLEPPTTTEE